MAGKPEQADGETENRAGGETLKVTRQEMIVREVNERGTMTIAQLSETFGVAEITIRRDLDELNEAGFLERIWGGVRARLSPTSEAPVLQRQKSGINEKRAIAAEAVNLINDGDLICLYMGTTTLELARLIAQKTWVSLQVVTNGLPIITELLRVPGIQLMCLGGLVDADEMAFYGVLTAQLVASVHIQKLFIGCRAIDPQHGITNAVQAEKEIGTIRAMVQSSGQVILLADHSKFGQVYFMETLPMTAIDVIVTDAATPENMLDAMKKLDISIYVARDLNEG